MMGTEASFRWNGHDEAELAKTRMLSLGVVSLSYEAARVKESVAVGSPAAALAT